MSPSVRPKTGPTLADFAGMGIVAAVCVGAGVGAGYWLGDTLRTGPVLAFAGLVVGVAAAVAATYSKIKRSF